LTSCHVELGQTIDRSVAATVYGLVDRGATLRPVLASAMRGSVRIQFVENYAPVRIVFGGTHILVADDAAGDPVDLEVNAALTDLVMLLSAPLAGGVPKPTTRTGRAALARWVDGRVDFSGRMGLARKLLQLMSVAPR
jgi:hypothetical protein